MRYLMTMRGYEPTLTNWIIPENNFNEDPELEMVVYDLHLGLYMTNGKDWHKIQEDHL